MGWRSGGREWCRGVDGAGLDVVGGVGLGGAGVEGVCSWAKGRNLEMRATFYVKS